VFTFQSETGDYNGQAVYLIW